MIDLVLLPSERGRRRSRSIQRLDATPGQEQDTFESFKAVVGVLVEILVREYIMPSSSRPEPRPELVEPALAVVRVRDSSR